jgi:hypothetical protein
MEHHMDPSTEPIHIFLDPDGTQEFGLYVIVETATGVEYSHQCAGLYNEIRTMEGFLVPLGGFDESRPLQKFFRVHFHGNPPLPKEFAASVYGAKWTEELLDELEALVAQIDFWKTSSPNDTEDDQTQRAFLHLDRSRVRELTEAWVPVATVYGVGVLVFSNSD